MTDIISRLQNATAPFQPGLFGTCVGWIGSSVYHGHYDAVPAQIGIMLMVGAFAILIAKGRDGV
jgi:hypothetical protein